MLISGMGASSKPSPGRRRPGWGGVCAVRVVRVYSEGVPGLSQQSCWCGPNPIPCPVEPALTSEAAWSQFILAGALPRSIVSIFSSSTEVSSCTQEQALKMFHKYLLQSNSYHLKNIVLKQYIFLVDDTEKQIRENKSHP